MKKLLLVFFVLAFSGCSFDNKTGIWKDASTIPVEDSNSKSISEEPSVKKYEEVFTKNKIFNEEKKPVSSTKIFVDKPIKITNWLEQYVIPSNNISNFSYNGNKILVSKSSLPNRFSLKKKNINKKIVFYQGNMISHDNKGTIFIYSLDLKKKIFEYNFYKKNFKGVKKEISFIVNNNILYAADNLGYLYALNLDNNSIIWAKNYGIPFRSNLKFTNNQIFLANQDNVIHSIDARTGNKNWQFATGVTYLKSKFINNFALDLINNNLFFLNTSGELYSINFLSQQINWVLNFKNPSLTGDVNLFLSQPLLFKNNNLIVSTEKSLLSYNSLTASKNWDLASEPIFKSIITLNHTYTILKNDLLICIDNISGDVVWSKNIFSSIQNAKVIKKFETIIDFKIVNSEINIYSTNGYLLNFNPNNGNLNSFSRISKKGINSEIIFLDNNLFLIDNNSKLLKFN